MAKAKKKPVIPEKEEKTKKAPKPISKNMPIPPKNANMTAFVSLKSYWKRLKNWATAQEHSVRKTEKAAASN